MDTKPAPLIAVVDDDASICRALKRLLQSVGMRVDTFPSGEAFLQFLDATPDYGANCVVLDLQMPHVNGIAVQRRLTDSGRATPLVFITAHDQAGAREAVLKGGAVAFLRKPVDDTLLIQSIQAALHGPRGRGLESRTDRTEPVPPSENWQ